MSAPPTIRIAAAADLGQVASLRQQWGQSRGFAGEIGDFEDRIRAWWERQGGSRVLYLAFDAELAMGMANLAVFEAMPHVGLPQRRWGYLAHCGSTRRTGAGGVATALLTTVIGRCRAGSFERVVVNPSAMSVPMYRRLGFRPADDLLRLDL